MAKEIVVETATPELIAAVRADVRIGQIAQAWKPALDQVWGHLAMHKELGAGHNFFLYHHPSSRDQPMAVDFGVQVAQRFEPAGAVHCVETPGGEVVRTVHVGPYARIGDAHNAIHAWCVANGRAIGAASWETYGDWKDNPMELETTITYLLA